MPFQTIKYFDLNSPNKSIKFLINLLLLDWMLYYLEKLDHYKIDSKIINLIKNFHRKLFMRLNFLKILFQINYCLNQKLFHLYSLAEKRLMMNNLKFKYLFNLHIKNLEQSKNYQTKLFKNLFLFKKEHLIMLID